MKNNNESNELSGSLHLEFWKCTAAMSVAAFVSGVMVPGALARLVEACTGSFPLLSFSLILVAGIVVATPQPRRSVLTRLVEQRAPGLAKAYIKAGGCLVGIVLGLAALHLKADGFSDLAFVVLCVLVTFLLAVAPLWFYESVVPLAMKYKDFMVAKRRNQNLLRFQGVTMICISSLGLLDILRQFSY